jgi:endonuclease/exonuclease/phosphatase family metal-dependent hydrolase
LQPYSRSSIRPWRLSVAALIVAAASLVGAADARVEESSRAGAPLSCHQVVNASGTSIAWSGGWMIPSAAGSRDTLDAWCRGVGPSVYEVPERSARWSAGEPLAIVSWNVNVGAGNLAEFVGDLRAGRFSNGRPVEHFVLLVQEALRTGPKVPAAAPGQASARRLLRGPTRTDIVAFARDAGLSLFYVPSMRNGRAKDAPSEDRGNAVLSTLPLDDARAVELPFERQRRVAAVATVGDAYAGDAIAVASVHFDPFVGRRKLWIFGAAGARARQARALIRALPTAPPLVVGGDLNTWLGTREPALAELTHMSGQRPRAEKGTFWTGAVLDYLFFRVPDRWQPAYDRARSTYGSDHYPLVGWIAPRPEQMAGESRPRDPHAGPR